MELQTLRCFLPVVKLLTSAIAGHFTTAEKYAEKIANIWDAEQFIVDDRMIIMPPEDGSKVKF